MSTKQTTTRRQAAPLPPGMDRYIFTERPRCKLCGSVRLPAGHTDRNGDGTITRKVKCQDCGANWLLVLE